MTLVTTWNAERDARAGVHLGEHRAVSALSARPAYEPQSNMADAQVEADEATEPVVQTQRQERDSLRAAYDTHARPGWLTLGILLLFAAEFAGCSGLLRDMGVAMPERSILAAALAAALWWIVNRVGSHAPSGGHWRWMWMVLSMVAAGIVFYAVGALRNAANPESGTAASILYICLSTGPALLIEWLAQKRKPAMDLRRQLVESEQKLKLVTTRLELARTSKRTVAIAQREWDGRYEKFMATYEAAWRREAARRGIKLPPTTQGTGGSGPASPAASPAPTQAPAMVTP